MVVVVVMGATGNRDEQYDCAGAYVDSGSKSS